MKRFILIVLYLALCLSGMAQTVIELPAEYLRNNVTGKNKVPEEMQGTPYWDPQFSSGAVFIYGKDAYAAKLRYNAFSDEIEMESNGTISALLKRDYISARIGRELYQVEKHMENGTIRLGYFIPLNDGPNRLLLRREMIFREGKKAESSYDEALPPRFEKSASYFISKDSAVALPIRLRKKDILQAFDNDRALESFVKTKKLKLRSVSEVIQVMDRMNRKE